MRRDEAGALGRLKRFLNKPPRIIREKIQRDEMWLPVSSFFIYRAPVAASVPGNAKPSETNFSRGHTHHDIFLAGCEWFGPAERYNRSLAGQLSGPRTKVPRRARKSHRRRKKSRAKGDSCPTVDVLPQDLRRGP